MRKRALITLAVCCLLALPVSAQRGGGGRGGGGMGGGGFRGGMGGGGFRGGMGGFGGGGFRGMGGFGGGFHGGGFRGFNNFGFRRGFGFRNNFFGNGFFGNGLGFGGWGWGGVPIGGWWGGGPWDWGGDWGGGWPVDGGGFASPAYAPAQAMPSSPVNIVYAPQTPVVVERANPVMHEYQYDQFGQQAQQPEGGGVAASPIFLLAFQHDHAIQAAASYWVNGQTLHYVTLQREEKQVPLSSLDRSLTLQLNRERRVPFQLP